MQIQRIGYGIRGFYRVAALGHLWEMTPKDALNRLKILIFFDKHGLTATLDAFDVSRRTLYRWKAVQVKSNGSLAALAGKSSAPQRRRQSGISALIVQQIRVLRTQYPNLGKAKLHVLLKPWCHAQGLALPSVSTIGRIIARAPDKMRHAPQRLNAKGRPKSVRRFTRLRKPKNIEAIPMSLWAVDTIERICDGTGLIQPAKALPICQTVQTSSRSPIMSMVIGFAMEITGFSLILMDASEESQ